MRRPKSINVNLGDTESLTRFVLAATIDTAMPTRADLALEMAKKDEQRSKVIQSTLSRYLSTSGPRIPMDFADEVHAAIQRWRLAAGEDLAPDWEFPVYRRRLVPGEDQRTGAGVEAEAFGELSRYPARTPAELFHCAEALDQVVRQSQVRHGWAELAPRYAEAAWTVRDRLLALTAGGGSRAQRAIDLLSRLAVERHSWDHIRAFVSDHPLGCRGVSIYTLILQRHVPRDAGQARSPLIEAVLGELQRRCSKEPANESLRAARGLTVEALGQITAAWAPDHIGWACDVLADRALDEHRTTRERAFAGLVFGKRFGAHRRDVLEAIRRSLVADPYIDLPARAVIRRHFSLMQSDFSQSVPGSERAQFYAAPLTALWQGDDATASAYDAIRALLHPVVDEAAAEGLVPHSVHQATKALLEAAIWDVDAVTRRVAIDTLRSAGLALPCSRALAALVGPDAPIESDWVRCTALSAIGLLQAAEPTVLDRVSHTGLHPLPGSTDPIGVRKAALLCLGDLLSEVDAAYEARVPATFAEDLGSSLVEHLTRGSETGPDPAPDGVRHAALYACGAMRSIHPSLLLLEESLVALGADAPKGDRLSEDLVARFRAEIMESLIRHPERSLDPSLTYRIDLLQQDVAQIGPDATFQEVVRHASMSEERDYSSSPALYAALAAAGSVGMERIVAAQRFAGSSDAPSHTSEVLARFQSMHRVGNERLTALYEAVLDAHGRRAIIPTDRLARMLTMFSEGVSSQAGVDPEVSAEFQLTPEEHAVLDLEPAPTWTLFSLACAILARELTRPR